MRKINSFKKLFALCLSCLCVMPGVVSCVPEKSHEVSSNTTSCEQASQQTTATVTDESPVICEHNYKETIEKKAVTFESGLKKLICKKCGHSETEIIPETKSIKILAIGNSYSVDAMEYLWDICRSGGVETVVLGNLTIAGCTLDMHYNNITNDSPAYDYTKWNASGYKTITEKHRISTVIKEEQWDVIVVNGHPRSSGLPSKFKDIGKIFEYLEENKPSEDTRLMFHMTWANQQNDMGNTWFLEDYNRDQLTMYNAIVSTALECVIPYDDYVDGVVASGTAIQNLRTSYIGDVLTRDGYHMSYDYGCYTVGLTWFATLTGGSVDNVSYVPAKYQKIENDLAVIRESVKNAVQRPYKITDSSYQ